jgi:hypothetical protein
MNPLDSSQPPGGRERPRLLIAGLLVYAVLAVASLLSGRAWIAALAVFVLTSAVLAPALRRGRVLAWLAWLAVSALLAWLARRGEGEWALDMLPIIVNAALCVLFARTLDSQPLVARFVEIVEGRERLAMPRVAGYARAVTWVWAVVLGAQALLLTVVICLVPGGVLSALGLPVLLAAPGWRVYLHVGGYAGVVALLGLEYAFRRWYLRDLPHLSLPVFLANLVRRWPALLQSLAADAARGAP